MIGDVIASGDATKSFVPDPFLFSKTGVFQASFSGSNCLTRSRARSETPSAYRPICLLDVEGKLFERVIVSRIDQHLRSGRGRNDLSPNQYGFRADRSTTDALDHVCARIRETLCRGGVAIAVSVDIKNAFYSVPWSAIRDGLASKSVPDYLTSIIGSFLSEWKITYEKPDGTTGRADVFCGVS